VAQNDHSGLQITGNHSVADGTNGGFGVGLGVEKSPDIHRAPKQINNNVFSGKIIYRARGLQMSGAAIDGNTLDTTLADHRLQAVP